MLTQTQYQALRREAAEIEKKLEALDVLADTSIANAMHGIRLARRLRDIHTEMKAFERRSVQTVIELTQAAEPEEVRTNDGRTKKVLQLPIMEIIEETKA